MNPLLEDLADEPRALAESWLFEFDRSWAQGELARRAQQLTAHPLRLPVLTEMVKIELERQWQQGNQALLESYLVQYPELGTKDWVDGDLILAEHQARLQADAAVSMEEFIARFPRHETMLRQAPISDMNTARVTRTPAPEPQPSPVTELPEQFGRYRIRQKLGQGGMGSVYLAHDTALDRLVALKVPTFAGDDAAALLQRFHREARAMAHFRDPHICPVYDVGEIGGVHYLTMAYVQGQSLADRLKETPVPAPAETATIIRKIALALAAAHQRGIVHRDLKPDNVLLDASGEPVVTDFGLARECASGQERLTHSGALMGTPAYMAPEQLNGAAGPASDIFSLGVILYEMLTGRRPFSGGIAELLWQISYAEPDRPSAIRPDVPSLLEAVALQAIAKAPQARFATMTDLARALEAYPGEAQPAQTATTSALPTPRRRTLLVSVAALVAVFTLVSAWKISGSQRPEPTMPVERTAPSQDGVRDLAPDPRVNGAEDPPPAPPTRGARESGPAESQRREAVEP